MRWRVRKSLVKAYEPSSRAALAEGPRQRRLAATKRSTMPATRGASGPMMVRLISSAIANCSRPSMSAAAMPTLLTLGSDAVPALPGATKTCSTRGDDAHFHASACSRPPPPTINTFMRASLMSEMAHSGEHHGDVVFVRRRDHFGIAPRAARLNDGPDAELGQRVQAVAKGKECVGGNRRGFQGQADVLGLHGGDFAADHPAHLSSPDP